jgi:hypothetical protein
MLAKSITYVDYNGEERTETFYFNISKAEVAEMQLKHPGGYAEYLQRIIDAKEQTQLVDAFKTIVLDAYGEKSEDGKRFKKSKEISEAFEQTEAYSELFMELLMSPDAAAAFINGILPKLDISDEQQAELSAKTKALIDSKK